jgi:hypothetical protein
MAFSNDKKQRLLDEIRAIKVNHSVSDVDISVRDGYSVVELQLDLPKLPRDMLKSEEGLQQIADIAAKRFVTDITGIVPKDACFEAGDPGLENLFCKVIISADASQFKTLRDAKPAIYKAMDEVTNPLTLN